MKPFALVALLAVLFSLLSTPAVRPASAAACNLPAKAGLTSEKLESGGVTRTYLLAVPRSYDGKTALPVVFSFHGFASNPGQQQQFSAWDTIGEREGFITVYPAGTGAPTRWYAGTVSFTGREELDDVKFFTDLLDELNKRLCLDSTHIFVTGLSNGGGMSHRLACEVGNRIAAIGTVSGAYSSLQGACNPVRPIPVITFHGTADKIVPYEGDEKMRFPAIQTWAADWAKRNSCQKGPTSFFQKDDVSAIQWTDCAQNADVQFYTIAEGGHTWPGGGLVLPFLLGKTTTTINASELMWAFFKAHPLPPAP